MKTCTKCGEEKQATPEYFRRNKNYKDGLVYVCKDCDREYRKQEGAKSKKKKFIYDDKKVKECTKCGEEKPATPDYFHKDRNKKDGLVSWCKECIKKKRKKYYQENKEEHSEYDKKYYQDNKEEKLEYSRNYYKENEDYFREYRKKYRQENKEYYREYFVTYHLENPEVSRLAKQRRRARMAQLPHTLTLDEWEGALKFFNYSCAYCGVPDDNLHQEHVIPVSKGGGYTVDNIIPACQSCNSSKYTTDLEEWYPSYRHYDEDRLNKILDYIEINS